MRTSTHTLMEAALWTEGVPVAGFDNGHLHAGGLIGVPEEMFRRRAGPGPDLTAEVLRESVPLVPPRAERRRASEDMSYADWHAGAEEEDEDEAEPEDGDDDGIDDDDALAEFAEEAAKSTHGASRAMNALAQVLRLRRQRAATGAAGGLFD